LTTEQGEIDQGTEAAKEIAKEIGLIDDPELTEYVVEIGQRLAAQSARSELEWHFNIVEMNDPNAFALPGGFVYVSRGLVALVNSEDELANVIGHEIGHVSARHSVSRQTRGVMVAPVQIAAGLGGWAASIVSPRLGQVIAGTGQLPGALALAQYSRGQERHADKLGQRYVADAGWNPEGMSTFMTALSREAALAGNDPDRVSFFDSHPPSPERSEETAKTAKKLERAAPFSIAGDRAGFLAKLDGLIVGTPAREGVFIGDRFLHVDMGFGLSFPPEWEHVNAHTFVLAQDDGLKAAFVLKLAGDDGDPMKAAQAFAQEYPLAEGPTEIEIGDLKAVQAVHVEGRGDAAIRADMTWVAIDGYVFQLAGVGPVMARKTLGPIFAGSARSFHRLTPAERKEVTEDRLRVATAEQGENLEQLAARTESRWDAKQLAIANGLADDAVLEAGQLLKITRAEPYQPTPSQLEAAEKSPEL
jgi:predicted Zn-dependent protease